MRRAFNTINVHKSCKARCVHGPAALSGLFNREEKVLSSAATLDGGHSSLLLLFLFLLVSFISSGWCPRQLCACMFVIAVSSRRFFVPPGLYHPLGMDANARRNGDWINLTGVWAAAAAAAAPAIIRRETVAHFTNEVSLGLLAIRCENWGGKPVFTPHTRLRSTWKT